MRSSFAVAIALVLVVCSKAVVIYDLREFGGTETCTGASSIDVIASEVADVCLQQGDSFTFQRFESADNSLRQYSNASCIPGMTVLDADVEISCVVANCTLNPGQTCSFQYFRRDETFLTLNDFVVESRFTERSIYEVGASQGKNCTPSALNSLVEQRMLQVGCLTIEEEDDDVFWNFNISSTLEIWYDPRNTNKTLCPSNEPANRTETTINIVGKCLFDDASLDATTVFALTPASATDNQVDFIPFAFTEQSSLIGLDNPWGDLQGALDDILDDQLINPEDVVIGAAAGAAGSAAGSAAASGSGGGPLPGGETVDVGAKAVDFAVDEADGMFAGRKDENSSQGCKYKFLDNIEAFVIMAKLLILAIAFMGFTTLVTLFYAFSNELENTIDETLSTINQITLPSHENLDSWILRDGFFKDFSEPVELPFVDLCNPTYLPGQTCTDVAGVTSALPTEHTLYFQVIPKLGLPVQLLIASVWLDIMTAAFAASFLVHKSGIVGKVRAKFWGDDAIAPAQGLDAGDGDEESPFVFRTVNMLIISTVLFVISVILLFSSYVTKATSATGIFDMQVLAWVNSPTNNIAPLSIDSPVFRSKSDYLFELVVDVPDTSVLPWCNLTPDDICNSRAIVANTMDWFEPIAETITTSMYDASLLVDIILTVTDFIGILVLVYALRVERNVDATVGATVVKMAKTVKSKAAGSDE